MAQKNRKTRYIIAFAAMIVLLVLLFCWNVGAGSVEMSLTDFVHLIQKRDADDTLYQIVWKIRLPRILAAILLGGALSVSGFLLQSFFRIPLRDHMCWEFHQGQSLLWRLS